jgi:hypothetical protein
MTTRRKYGGPLKAQGREAMNEPMLKRKLLARLWVAILLTLVLVPAAIAGERGPADKEVKELEAEIAKARMNPEQFRQMVATVQATLGMYGFGAGPFDGVLDEKTQTALRRYQQVRHLSVTGDINAATFKAVEHDLELFMDQPVKLPFLHVSVDFWQDGYVYATGTWTIVGEKQAFPEQATQINCYKAWGTCFEATAQLDSNNVLGVDLMPYTIERWDEHEITTKPYEKGCVAYTMRISRVSKAVMGYRMRNPEHRMAIPEVCKGLNPELQLKLANGFDVYWELYRKRGEKIQGLLQAPGLRGKP